MAKIKTGVIGVGHLGSIHTRVYHELSDLCEFAGIYDANPERAKEIAEQYNVKAFDSLEDFFDNVDAASCAAPTTKHFQVGMKAAERGCHLLMEKPITEKYEEGEKLVQEFEKQKLVLMVGHTERFNPAMEICRHVDIKPKFIEGHRLAQFNPRGTDVAVIYDLMIHDIDIILKFMGEEPSQVHAVGVPVITPYVDIANVRLEFPSGCVANITTSRISLKKMRKIRIFQENGYISLDFLTKQSEMVCLNESSIPNKEELYTKGFSLSDFNMKQYSNKNEPLKAEITDFITSIQEGRKPEISGRDGLKALKICSFIEEKIISSVGNKLG